MADLSTPDRDRAQIILIAGFVLAVTFVALALILNSVIFTENLATRSESVGGSGPTETRDMLEEGAGEIVRYVNRNNFTSNDTLWAAASGGIGAMDNATANAFATRGQIASIEYSDQTNGTRFFQNDSARDFSSAGLSNDWDLATSITQTRAFTFAVNTSEVDSATSCTNGPCFRVNVTEDSGAATGDTWGVAIYEDSGSGDLNVTAYNETGVIGTCQNESTGTVRVDVTDGRIDGDRCPTLNFGEGIDRTDPYEIRYVNGDAAGGNYSLTVTTDGGLLSLSTLTSGNFNSTSDPPPYAVRAIYASQVNMTYVTNDLSYEIGIRVAPGEPE